MTNKPVFIKNEDELFMMMSLVLSYGEMIPTHDRTSLMRIILEDYRRLVNSDIIKPFNMPKPDSDDIEGYNELIMNIKHLMMVSDFPMHEDDKGNLVIDHETLVKRYLNKELPFQKEGDD